MHSDSKRQKRSNARKKGNARKTVVPRVPPTAGKRRAAKTPNPDRVNIKDEDYATAGKPLVAGSREAKALHHRSPRSKVGLGVGTAGDAARPSKAGLHDTSVPPRGAM